VFEEAEWYDLSDATVANYLISASAAYSSLAKHLL
jgi:hypothetical protein